MAVRDNGQLLRRRAMRVTTAGRSAEGTTAYRTGGFVGAYRPRPQVWAFAQGFDHYYDDFDLSRFENGRRGSDAEQRVRPARVVDHALAWLAGEGDQPFFRMGGISTIPQSPYVPPEPYRFALFPATLEGA